MFLSEKIIKNFDASFYEFDVANNFFDAANFSATDKYTSVSREGKILNFLVTLYPGKICHIF